MSQPLRWPLLALLVLGSLTSAASTPLASSDAPVPGPASAAPVGAGAALPPGHPPTSDALPPGHPTVGPGAPAERAPALYRAPTDIVVDDPLLPKGTLVVQVRDADGAPAPNATVILGILKGDANRGESRSQRVQPADATGELRFDGLDAGMGVSYRVSSQASGAAERYMAPPFVLGAESGKRVTLHVYPATSNLEGLLVGTRALLYIAIKEDRLQIEHLIGVFNMSKTAWVPSPATVQLPDGMTGFQRQDAMGEAQLEEVKGQGYRLVGLVKPGSHEFSFRYQVPLGTSERQALQTMFPPNTAQVRVLFEGSRSMGLEAPGFSPAERTQAGNGKDVWIAEQVASQRSGGIRSAVVTLTGLPTPGPGRWIAAGLALALAAVSIGLRVQGKAGQDAAKDLARARQQLLDAARQLEVDRKAGHIGPESYARIRAELLDMLARVLSNPSNQKS